jgi:hypothetical protein
VLFHVSNGGPQDNDTLVTQSATKMVPAVEIIVREVQAYGPDAHIAVFMDSPALTHGRSPGLLDGVDLIRTLEARPELAGMSIVMLTGASIVVPARMELELSAAVQHEAHMHGWETDFQLRTNVEFVELTGTGRDWNSVVYVELVRTLMRQGLADCVLCPLDVLPWGIQAMPFNTAIDLTSGTHRSYVHVPDHPTEIPDKDTDALVNYWDIVSLASDGGVDWQRLMTKHTALECPSDELIVEVGPTALDAQLARMKPDSILQRVKEWNTAQLERSGDRKGWQAVWKKSICGAARVASLIITPEDGFPGAIRCEAVVRDSLAEEARMYDERRIALKLHHTLWTVAATGLALSGILVYEMETGIYIAAAILAGLVAKIVTRWWSVRGTKPRMHAVGREEFIARAAHAVYDALKDVSDDELQAAADALSIAPRSDGSYRVLLRTEVPGVQEAFYRSFLELFNPGAPDGYAVVADAFRPGKKRLQTILAADDLSPFYNPEYVLPVPQHFTQTRAHAEVFRAAWQRHIGRARLYLDADITADLPQFGTLYPAAIFTSYCRV